LLVGLSPGSSFFNATGARAASRRTQSARTDGSARTAAQPPSDRGWPRDYTTPSEAQVVLYQPQVASWENQKHMVAYAAASYLPRGMRKQALGTLKVETDTQVALDERLVKFSALKITETNFPTLQKEQIQELIAEIDKAIPDEDRFIALDRVLAQVDKSQIVPKNVEGMKSDPPKIFYSQTPAIMLALDGDPIWSPIKENDLKFAVNTNWDLFQHTATGVYYLRHDTTWLRAADLKGPWSPAGKLPESFMKLPADDNWKLVRENLPGKPAASAPTVFFTTTPSELILLDGAPRYVAVPGTGLLWVSNTESDLFRMGKDGPVYYLVAGRWFKTTNLKDWEFATPSLPEAFKLISLEHPRSRVLASVPGTQQAAEAVLLARVPQTAHVNIRETKAPAVIYQGDPQYQAIEGTQLARAVNVDKDIVKSGDMYFMCYEGVWFTSSQSNGPWTVATSVPAEIYQIPPSSPAYNVTYVTVEDEDSNDDWVEFAAYAGYTGMMIGWGCTMWGTGWYYPPYYGYGGYYPIYYPPLRTYGYGSWYNPYTGRYGTAGRINGPYGGVGFGARYNPSTGTYARGAYAYGPFGARGAAEAYNSRTGTYASTRQGSGVYGSWGSTNVQRGDQWASTKRFTNSSTGNTTRVTRGENGSMVRRKGENGSGFVGNRGDNVYAGRDGNVYRRDQNGNWNKWDNGSWNPAQKPDQSVRDRMMNDSARQRERDNARGERFGQSGGQMDRSTLNSLNRDRAARNDGARRARDSSSYRNRSGGNAGSYRSSGNFSRGGGGFSRGGGFRGGGRRR
ncbi:MAG: hypothetical protein JO360_07485, partial [Acidobacteria bacterium]|nr:hypothetical protein [Acidobacteriota bacterium]